MEPEDGLSQFVSGLWQHYVSSTGKTAVAATLLVVLGLRIRGAIGKLSPTSFLQRQISLPRAQSKAGEVVADEMHHITQILEELVPTSGVHDKLHRPGLTTNEKFALWEELRFNVLVRCIALPYLVASMHGTALLRTSVSTCRPSTAKKSTASAKQKRQELSQSTSSFLGSSGDNLSTLLNLFTSGSETGAECPMDALVLVPAATIDRLCSVAKECISETFALPFSCRVAVTSDDVVHRLADARLKLEQKISVQQLLGLERYDQSDEARCFVDVSKHASFTQLVLTTADDYFNRLEAACVTAVLSAASFKSRDRTAAMLHLVVPLLRESQRFSDLDVAVPQAMVQFSTELCQ